MKKTIIFAAFAALVLASACTERVDIPELVGENVISLDLVYGDPATRADDQPSTTDGTPGENKVASVQYFFYNDVTANPIYNSGRITITDQTPGFSATELKYSVTLVAGEGDVPDLTTMFMNTECIVYGVFNAAEISAAPLATVKATALSNTFAHEGDVAGSSTGSKWIVNLDSDQCFVMAGELALTRVSGQAYAAQGTVEMNRVAAKIAVDLKIKKEVTGKDGKVWIPMLGGDQIRLYPQNVAGAAVLGGADATNPTYPTDLDQFAYKEIIYNSEIGSSYVTDDGTYYVIASQQDFYTYPQSFTKGSDDEPFIKIIVPWRGKSGTTSQKEIYYKVMFPDPDKVSKIEANKYYKLTVVVSVLGNEGEPEVTLEPLSAQVVNWQGDSDVNGTISAPMYLSVDRGVKEPFEFYTTTSLTSYAASDPVTMTILEIKQANLKTGNDDYLFRNGAPVAATLIDRGLTEATVRSWIKLMNTTVEFGHQLDSDLTSPQMDVAPYYYTVVLSLPTDIDPHTSDYPYGKYAKTVTFIQWPEVYVVADPNSDYAASSSHNNNKGYVYINGGTSDFGGVAGWSTGSNTNSNQNMYVLTVSVSNTYIIGDPRSTSVDLIGYTNNQGRSNYAQARWTEDSGVTNHRLTYYYPGARQNTDNMIAPKIRIASSYGKASTMSKEQARRRCASYQEDGIPAGRWRLPTFAEVQFIATLSSLGRIPFLFSDESTTNGDYYWIANGNSDTTGAALVDNVGNDKGVTEYLNRSQNCYIRCVYDEWYWGDATKTRPLTNRAQFTWGDRQRTN